MLDRLPPIAGRNASETGTDVVGYLAETQGFGTFVLDDGPVVQDEGPVRGWRWPLGVAAQCGDDH